MSSIEFDSRRDKTPVPDLRINLKTMSQALGAIVEHARAHRGYTFFTFNLDHLVKIAKDRRFSDAYDRADFVTADGWPIVWLARQDGYDDLERTTGADLLEPVCAQAAANAIPVYFVGPGPHSQAAALDILRARYPGIPIAGAETPDVPVDFSSELADAIAARVVASGARLCVLSLGAPKQELLADALYQRCPEVGFLCFGAALDFISGDAQRAPMWMRRNRLEWFWRLMSAPRRMATRYSQCGLALVKFALPSVFPRGLKLSVIAPGAARR